MPKLLNTSTSLVAQTISNFGFSGTQIEDLKDLAGEFTLADIEIDVSPSTDGFMDDLKKAIGVVVESLAKSPNSDKMLVRVESFNESLNEIHGFASLQGIQPGDYNLNASGRGTALYDATLSGIEACGAYGKLLDDQDFSANAVVFVITDGMENRSTTARTTQAIIQGVAEIRKTEQLESIKLILIGIGDKSETNNQTKEYLAQFKDDAQIDQYIWIEDATPTSLAKLADFISKSVSSASQALGTGGPSKNLTF